MNWVTIENQAFDSRYTFVPDGQEHTFENQEVAETLKATFTDGITFEAVFYRASVWDRRSGQMDTLQLGNLCTSLYSNITITAPSFHTC